MRPRILHVVPGTPYGGIQRFVAWLSAEQIRQGFDVRVAVIYNESSLANLLKENETPFYQVAGQRPSISGAITFRSLLRDLSPHIVHLHAPLLWINLCGLLWKRCPWIYHAHSYWPEKRSVKIRMLGWSLQSLCDARIAVSTSVAEDGPPGFRTFLVHDGIKIDSEEPKAHRARDGHPLVFGFASRLVRDKGLSAFIEVAASIISLHENVCFVIAGDGSDAREFRSEIVTRNLVKYFTFLGRVDDMRSFWSQIDILLFVAPRDTFGLTIIEAMARQVPVAAYRTASGSAELLVHDQNSLLANYGAAKELARAALALAQDVELRTRITDKARRMADDLTITETAKKVVAVYRSLRPDIFLSQ